MQRRFLLFLCAINEVGVGTPPVWTAADPATIEKPQVLVVGFAARQTAAQLLGLEPEG